MLTPTAEITDAMMHVLSLQICRACPEKGTHAHQIDPELQTKHTHMYTSSYLTDFDIRTPV
jgi:hypothetical protein